MDKVRSSLVLDGTLNIEEISIKYIGLDGISETPAYDSAGSLMTLKLTRPAVPITGGCWLKVSKPSTTNAVGVNICGL